MWTIIALLTVNSVASQDWPVLAVRVSFPKEIPDEPTTTGDGRFDLRTPDEAGYTLPYDLPPHDRRYFEAHLRALGQYWYVASGGRLVLSFDLYPKEDTASYTMPRPLVWYGSGKGEEATARLVRLFKDAVAALDSAENIDFSSFRSIIVFHAGAGRETGRYNDIPSAYLTPEDFSEYGPAVVDGDTIREGMILPEMADTSGVVGLNGLLAKVFGYSLGLPELSNTKDGLPAMGGWSLMDVGWLNPIVVQDTTAWGFVPCLPSAWELMRLGWLEPLEVVRDTTISVCAAHISKPPKGAVRAVKVPVGPGEYFLIENREAHRPYVELSQGNNVWVNVDNYDAFVPGSGVLIWHVDERIISERPEGINDDPLHRGIDLEEADGDEAIGNPYRRRGMWGGPEDPFFLGGRTRFGPDTEPSSESNEGWDTGIEVEVLDQPRDLMRVRVSFGRNFPGWPKETSEDLTLSAPLPMAYEIFILGRGKLYMFGLRDTSISLPSEPWGMPAAGDLDGDGRIEVAFADSSGRVWWPVRGTWDSVSVGFHPTAGPIVTYGGDVVVGGDGEVAFVRPGGEVKLKDVEGRTLGMAFGKGLGLVCATDEGLFSVGERVRKLWSGGIEKLSGPVVGDMDGDRKEEVTLASGGKIFAYKVLPDTVLQVRGFPISVGEDIRGLCMGDIDGDGVPELVASGKGRVYAWHGTGAQVEGFPVAPLSWDGAGEVSVPILADVDGDGVAEVIFSAENVGVYAFRGDGRPVRGFPVPVPEGKLSAPFVGDIDGDRWVEVGAISGGKVYLWRTKGVRGGAEWPVVGGDLDRAGYFPSEGVSPGGGKELLSGVYVYPNPTEGMATLRFKLGRYSKVKVQVLDGMGRPAEEREEEIEGGVREVPLDLSKLPPGLYLVRVKARSGGEVQEDFVKIGVVR